MGCLEASRRLGRVGTATKGARAQAKSESGQRQGAADWTRARVGAEEGKQRAEPGQAGWAAV